MTAPEYRSWAASLLAEQAAAVPLAEAFPELVPAGSPFDGAMATVERGTAVVLAFKTADDLGYAEVLWLLHRTLEMIPRPGAVDAIGYAGLLVLVFERPLDSVKRDRLLALRRRRWWRRGLALVAIAELDRAALSVRGLPALLAPLAWPLESALERRGTAPALAPAPPRVGQREARAPVAAGSIALVALLSALHAGVFLAGPEDSPLLRLYRAGERHNGAILDGETWRFVTPNFLHWSWDHLIGNVIALFEYGRGVEALFGAGWLLAVFVAAGAAGNGFSWLLSPGPISAGASASVFGLGGMLAAVYAFRRDQLTLRFRAHFFGAAVLASGYVIVRGFAFGQGIDNFGHLGGLLAGFAIGAVLPFAERGGGAAGRALGWIAAVASLLAGGAALARRPAAAQPGIRHEDVALRVSFKRPVGFTVSRVEAGGLKADNFLTARFQVYREAGTVDWMFAAGPATVRRHWEETLAAEAGRSRMSLRDVTESRVGGLRAMSVVYDYRDQGPPWRIEQVYVPQREDHLRLMFTTLVRDEAYYAPIRERVKGSFVSLAPPPEGLAR